MQKNAHDTSVYVQAGFAMLEAGVVQNKNMSNILFKNMVDCSIAAVCYWLIGYGVRAYVCVCAYFTLLHLYALCESAWYSVILIVSTHLRG